MFVLCTEIKMASRKCGHSTTDSCTTSSKKHARKVSKVTFNKWKRHNEAADQTMSWLSCELERDRSFVAMLYCSVCKRFKQNIQSQVNQLSAGVSAMCPKLTSSSETIAVNHSSTDNQSVISAETTATTNTVTPAVSTDHTLLTSGERAILQTALVPIYCNDGSIISARYDSASK